LIKDNKIIFKLCLDRLPVVSEVEVYDISQLLEDEDCISKFDCRKGQIKPS
ncbi:hypothetical protein BCV72DRAFT_181636, partial [Rhizopus microsporus var. microsporus]